MMDTGKACEQCGNTLLTDARHAARMRFCSDSCRYQAWKAKKEKELADLVRQLAGRVRL